MKKEKKVKVKSYIDVNLHDFLQQRHSTSVDPKRFDILEKLEEQNLLHIRDRIFGALEDRDILNVGILPA